MDDGSDVPPEQGLAVHDLAPFGAHLAHGQPFQRRKVVEKVNQELGVLPQIVPRRKPVKKESTVKIHHVQLSTECLMLTSFLITRSSPPHCTFISKAICPNYPPSSFTLLLLLSRYLYGLWLGSYQHLYIKKIVQGRSVMKCTS